MLKRLIGSFSVSGLFAGLLFLCASLTPSLLPRIPVTQGALNGVAFAVGYGTGKGLHFLWRWLGGTRLFTNAPNDFELGAKPDQHRSRSCNV